MRFDRTKGALYGIGSEKKVYETKDPKKLAKDWEECQYLSPWALKASYWLTKIVCLLFPKNFPTQFSVDASKLPYREIVSKVEMNSGGHAMRQRRLIENSRGERRISLFPMTNVHSRALEEAVNLEDGGKKDELESELEDVGLEIDGAKLDNFALSKDGNLIYLDSCYAWTLASDKKIVKWFNEQKLKQAIITRLSGEPRERALRFLERILKLYKEELELQKDFNVN